MSTEHLCLFWPGAGLPISMKWIFCTLGSAAFFSQNEKMLLLYPATSLTCTSAKHPAKPSRIYICFFSVLYSYIHALIFFWSGEYKPTRKHHFSLESTPYDITWQLASCWARSNTFSGAFWFVMSMWNAAVLPIKAIFVSDTYFQKVTTSGISACFSFCLESKSYTYLRVNQVLQYTCTMVLVSLCWALTAIMFLVRCIKMASAFMGFLSAAYPLDESMITQSYTQQQKIWISIYSNWWATAIDVDYTYRAILDTDVLFGFEGEVAKLEEVLAQTQVGQLENLVHLNR